MAYYLVHSNMRETAKTIDPLINRTRIDQCIENLCQNGCAAVRATIVALESGLVVSQTEGMSAEECRMVLTELKAIMEVYDRPCPL